MCIRDRDTLNIKHRYQGPFCKKVTSFISNINFIKRRLWARSWFWYGSPLPQNIENLELHVFLTGRPHFYYSSHSLVVNFLEEIFSTLLSALTHPIRVMGWTKVPGAQWMPQREIINYQLPTLWICGHYQVVRSTRYD